MRKIKALSVKVGSVPVVVEIEDSLEVLQGYVGGLIDFVSISPRDHVDMIINDEGKILGLPINRIFFHNDTLIDVVVGDFLIVKIDDMGRVVSLTDSLIKKYQDIFKETEVSY